ncbi:hypothetical protein MMPV_006802 [Pyropia vietnamensis]
MVLILSPSLTFFATLLFLYNRLSLSFPALEVPLFYGLYYYEQPSAAALAALTVPSAETAAATAAGARPTLSARKSPIDGSFFAAFTHAAGSASADADAGGPPLFWELEGLVATAGAAALTIATHAVARAVAPPAVADAILRSPPAGVLCGLVAFVAAGVLGRLLRRVGRRGVEGRLALGVGAVASLVAAAVLASGDGNRGGGGGGGGVRRILAATAVRGEAVLAAAGVDAPTAAAWGRAAGIAAVVGVVAAAGAAAALLYLPAMRITKLVYVTHEGAVPPTDAGGAGGLAWRRATLRGAAVVDLVLPVLLTAAAMPGLSDAVRGRASVHGRGEGALSLPAARLAGAAVSAVLRLALTRPHLQAYLDSARAPLAAAVAPLASTPGVTAALGAAAARQAAAAAAVTARSRVMAVAAHVACAAAMVIAPAVGIGALVGLEVATTTPAGGTRGVPVGEGVAAWLAAWCVSVWAVAGVVGVALERLSETLGPLLDGRVGADRPVRGGGKRKRRR